MSSPAETTQLAQPSEPRELYLGIQAVDVFVRDLERSLQFYVDQLGFKIVADVVLQSGQRRVQVSPPDRTASINLIAPPADSEERQLIGRETHIVLVTEDVAAKYAEWRKRGVRFQHSPRLRRIKYLQQAPARLAEQTLLFGEQPPIWGGVFTRFEDPDRNSFALISLDEVSRAIEERRRTIVAKLEAERRSAHELEIARQVQARLFPQALLKSKRWSTPASACRLVPLAATTMTFSISARAVWELRWRIFPEKESLPRL